MGHWRKDTEEATYGWIIIASIVIVIVLLISLTLFGNI